LPLELREVEETPLADSLERLRTLVSPHTGIVGGAGRLLAAPDDIRLVSVYCETGEGGDVVGWPGTHPGNGSGRTAGEAFAAAVGEAAERYSACYTAESGAVVSSARELGANAVAPERFALYSELQHAGRRFPYARFTRDTRVAWVRASTLPSGEAAYLPAQLVYLAWRLLPGEARIGLATSNGLAAHASAEEAVLRGLLELLERDAFMITWRARLSWPRLTWEGNARLEDFERRYLHPTGIRVAAIDLSDVWSMPCAVGVARSGAPGDAPLGVGAGAAATVEAAVEKALDEAVRVRSWARTLRRRDPDGARVRPPERIRRFDEHVAFYARDENARRAGFLDAGEGRRHVREVPQLEETGVRARIEAICARLHGAGASAYAVDVTAPDVRDAGLRVVRVVAPELCPLDVEHATRCLGGRRLYEVPRQLGVCAAVLSVEDLNPDPHPFP